MNKLNLNGIKINEKKIIVSILARSDIKFSIIGSFATKIVRHHKDTVEYMQKIEAKKLFNYGIKNSRPSSIERYYMYECKYMVQI